MTFNLSSGIATDVLSMLYNELISEEDTIEQFVADKRLSVGEKHHLARTPKESN